MRWDDNSSDWERRRMVFPKRIKNRLLMAQKGKCAYCGRLHRMRCLQIDHKYPLTRSVEAAAMKSRIYNFSAFHATCVRESSPMRNFDIATGVCCLVTQASLAHQFPKKYLHLKLRLRWRPMRCVLSTASASPLPERVAGTGASAPPLPEGVAGTGAVFLWQQECSSSLSS